MCVFGIAYMRIPFHSALLLLVLLKGTILKLRKRPIAHKFKRVKGKKHINLISRNSNFMACN